MRDMNPLRIARAAADPIDRFLTGIGGNINLFDVHVTYRSHGVRIELSDRLPDSFIRRGMEIAQEAFRDAGWGYHADLRSAAGPQGPCRVYTFDHPSTLTRVG